MSQPLLPARLGVAALLALPPAQAAGLAAAPTEAAAGEKRVLVIDTPALETEAYRVQAGALIAAWDGLLERDLHVIARTGAPAFRVRLKGKDGGVKLDSAAPVSTAELFALIDAMPMRRAELKARAEARRP